ncbi:MAG: 2,3-bisphosphoglycerate-independent phosphoglycerate mutase [Anaerolineae bacterium]
MESELVDSLVVTNDTKIIFLIIDGLGGLPMPGKGGTELQVADLPNLDQLASRSACGLLEPIGPGIIPGSGPAHLALFGYDPIKYNIGRGVLSALGIDFDLRESDVAARVNFATVDREGRITDRRAGRIDNPTNDRLCARIRQEVNLGNDVEFFFEREKEYRALFVLRGEELYSDIEDTDPQQTGVPPRKARATHRRAERTAQLVQQFVNQVERVLAQEERANMILLRGFAKYQPYKSLKERFGLNALAIANYPMYRGLARLVGMDLYPMTKNLLEEFEALEASYDGYDFFFLHIKEPDSRGEDGNFDAKVAVLEEIDRWVPRLTALQPDVLVVTGDHSTPSTFASHSWHPVPVLLQSPYCRVDHVDRFDEISCAGGSLGLRPMTHLVPLVLANAKRLTKFGA